MVLFASWAISTFVGSLSELIPGRGYVQNAVDIYDGVKKSVLSAIKWLGKVYSGWGVELLDGSPEIMATALARHNATALSGGLKDVAIATTKTGLQASGDSVAGVGAIVGAVTGILQRIANMVGYCAQRFLMNRMISQADQQWKSRNLETNHIQFNRWFNRVCFTTPIVAALTLNIGFAAHPYRFLALISDSDNVIDQKDFDKGVKHIENLKALSKQYLSAYQDNYKVIIKSDDPVVAGLLENMKV